MIKIVYTEISHKNMNEMLTNLQFVGYHVFHCKPEEYPGGTRRIPRCTVFVDESGSINHFIHIKNKFSKWENYRINLSVIRDENYAVKDVQLGAAVSNFVKKTNIKPLGFHMTHASPLYYCNDKYLNKEISAISYDANKAYLSACSKPIFPIDEPKYWCNSLKAGEMGFNTATGKVYYGPFNGIVEYKCHYGYHKGLQTWAREMADKLNNAKNKLEKNNVKKQINACIGNLSNKHYPEKNNDLFRNIIVQYCTDRIQSLMDENTIFCNTDCIVSLKPRTDIPVSNNIGDFKIEHSGTFYYVDQVHYQWNDDKINGINDDMWKRIEEHGGVKLKNLLDITELKDEFTVLKFNKETNQYEEK